MNKSYCTLAWLGITTDPDGSVRPCCVSNEHITKDNGKPFNLGLDSLEEIHNSNSYKELRRAMLNGEHIEGCSTCYNNEEYGRESRRLISNESFKDTIFTDVHAETKIKYFDLRLGNLCNLKCRMCNPTNSSLIEQELNENPSLGKFYFSTENKNVDWFDTETFDNNINSQLNNVVTLYMTGGEPTVIKKNYDILQRLIDVGQNKVTTLIINTNLTNSNPKFYDLITKFDKVIIQMSIDAVGDLDNYIRYPTVFADVDKTIKDLIALNSNIKLRAGPVIQSLNLNKLVDLFEYLENFNRIYKRQVIDIRPGFVFLPSHLNMIYLPTQYKIDCYKKIYLWMMDKCRYQSTQFKDAMQALKKKCYEDNFDSNQLKEFLEFNNELDKIRNTKLELINPELYDIVSKNV